MQQMVPYSKKFIITGAPGTGKTTLINALKKYYPCMDEVSRKVIAKEQKTGGHGTPWQDLSKFTELVFEIYVSELVANPEAMFTDRSILDLVAYLQVEGKPIPKNIDQFPYHSKFHKTVFFTPIWKLIYRKDEQRQQGIAYSLELERALEVNYDKKGFEIVKLPKDSVSNRVQFVQETMKSINS